MNYIRRPDPIQAVQFRIDNLEAVKTFCGDQLERLVTPNQNRAMASLVLTTWFGLQLVIEGDYVLKDQEGGLHACRKDTFEAAYILDPNKHPSTDQRPPLPA